MEIKIVKASNSELKAKPLDGQLGFGQIFTDHMFVMKFSEDEGWHDAKIQKYQDFSMDPSSMVLHYGQAIFEGLKAYRADDGSISLFRPTANLARMNRSAKRMCMAEFDEEDILEALQELLEIDQDWVPHSKGATLYIRPTMIATEAGLGVRPSREYLFFIILSPVGAYYPEGFNPVKIFVTDTYVRAVKGGVGEAKTAGNYAASIMAAVDAKKKGYTQVLWLDAVERRYVEEVGTMNIFFKINDEIITPPLNGSILPGITRDSVLQLVRAWGLNVSERQISIDEVFAASENGSLQEVFGTGTAAVISPVGSLFYNEKQIIINNAETGELAQRLFDELEAIQYGSQKEDYGWVLPLSGT